MEEEEEEVDQAERWQRTDWWERGRVREGLRRWGGNAVTCHCRTGIRRWRGRDWVSTRSEGRGRGTGSVFPTLAPEQARRSTPPSMPVRTRRHLSRQPQRKRSLETVLQGAKQSLQCLDGTIAPSTSITADVNPKDAIRQKQATPHHDSRSKRFCIASDGRPDTVLVAISSASN